jgi:hypothetical protein
VDRYLPWDQTSIIGIGRKTPDVICAAEPTNSESQLSSSLS